MEKVIQVGQWKLLEGDTNLTRVVQEGSTILIEKELLDLIPGLGLPKDSVVLDIGAYVGDTAMWFAGRYRTLAFEAQPDAFQCLCYNSPKSINFNVPVGDGSRVICGEESVGGNLGTRQVLACAEGIQSLPIDMLGLGRVDFIKIDVEGFEAAVLAGAMATIHSRRPKMIIEVYPEMLERQRYDRGDIESHLRDLGYKWHPIIGNESEPRWDILAEPA